jgi:hypothetical protein
MLHRLEIVSARVSNRGGFLTHDIAELLFPVSRSKTGLELPENGDDYISFVRLFVGGRRKTFALVVTNSTRSIDGKAENEWLTGHRSSTTSQGGRLFRESC